MSIHKIAKDPERVRGILDMVGLIEDRMKKDDKDKFLPLILSDYYEIIKELITAILLCDGFKTTSYMELIEYLKRNYKEFNFSEILVLDRLRILRNKVVYEGLKISSNYLSDNENTFLKIIKKLKSLTISKLNKHNKKK